MIDIFPRLGISGVHGPGPWTQLMLGDRLERLKAGTPVFCKLAGYFEHTGIAMGDTIIHLDGSGEIVRTSPKVFLARLDGLNLAFNIYYAATGENQPLAKRVVADRARRWVGRHVEYNVLTKNCHGFVLGCLTGDFNQILTLDLLQVEAQISKIFANPFWQWRCWDGWR